MNENRLDPRLLTVGELFDDANTTYTVPIYQRNYAWQAEQIEQLLRDICDAIHDGEESYFLGNLMVTETGTLSASFEVIDGQQRLTTLYLLLSFLAERQVTDNKHQGRLRYASRQHATEALRRISLASPRHHAAPSQASNTEDAGIHQGYNVIRQFMAQHIAGQAELNRFARFLREKVMVVRASLPRKTDFNRYFEIMNTRGQQLRQADIVKARLMHYLEDDAQRACFAWIWEACSDMDSYVQMSLTRGNTALRDAVFGDDWSWLVAESFDELRTRLPATGTAAGMPSSAPLTLDAALEKYARADDNKDDEDKENERFRSTIEFTSFLLHVLKVMRGDAEEEEGRLDDKSLIKRFDEVLEHQGAAKSEWVRKFAFALLRYRNLFDGFILKRQYTTNSDEGDWSLQRLVKRHSGKQPTPGYRNTFSRGAGDTDEDGRIDSPARDLLTLQSMLRVTYTSPRTMHWITLVLKLLAERRDRPTTTSELADALREYARGKVREAFFVDEEPRGFGIARIVFTYLDYLLWTERPDPEFRFSFRNSIEHFYPQNPDEQQSGAKVSDGCLHLLGNLALVSVGTNSKFGNALPSAKAYNFRETIEIQSPKLHDMAEMTRARQGWSDKEVKEHHGAVIARLRGDLGI